MPKTKTRQKTKNGVPDASAVDNTISCSQREHYRQP